MGGTGRTVDSGAADTGKSRRKCSECGLVNFAANEECRRCGAALPPVEAVEPETAVQSSTYEARGIGRRLLWLIGVTVALVFLWSRSLLLTSEAIDDRQQQIVLRAVSLLDRSGFSREALVLRHFANYCSRTTGGIYIWATRERTRPRIFHSVSSGPSRPSRLWYTD
jgi:hypothetical protein